MVQVKGFAGRAMRGVRDLSHREEGTYPIAGLRAWRTRARLDRIVVRICSARVFGSRDPNPMVFLMMTLAASGPAADIDHESD
jgi:hypothetical protein